MSVAVVGSRCRELALLVARRLAFAVPVLVIVAVGVFLLAAASPFDPIYQYYGVDVFTATAEDLAATRARLGLDDGVLTQLGRWLAGIASGDLGTSRSLRQPVAQVIAERLPWTLLLVTVALVVAIVLSLVAGVVAAWCQGGLFDRMVTAIGHAMEGIPPFVLALVAIAIFALGLGWFPVAGLTDAGAPASAEQVLRHLALPALVLGVSQTPWLVLHVRGSLLAALGEDHVAGARARGLTEATVVLRHALPTALLPFVTLLGTRVPELVTGAVLVETVFSWPGIAEAVVTAALAVDFPLLAALSVLATAAVLLGSLAADVAVALADPRVRADG
ncbi:ABC transporter permease [Pseudonocardia asaccharolytica]|uniref:ABC transporter permease n=1 Tax=Pseudonocardia asaccharolytica DSM 44247 = NBRC 16224 TaxID=1123024 RepID=A0A511D1R5_9PSEU|nr:ABC transporter permease [Pseudonocardia asaccharolytica]GEL18721.1 ABC transporter permease [Pseudonocardia asaccharolytica DSM 44247 = NBRC 16224]